MTELCPTCVQRVVDKDGWWHLQDDGGECPLCGGSTYGSFVTCEDCAGEAGVCVLDGRPLDGSSTEPWVEGLVPVRDRWSEGVRRPRPVPRPVRRLTGIWRSGPAHGPDVYLVLEDDMTGALATLVWDQLTHVSRFRWALDDDVLEAQPWPLDVVPEDAQQDELELSATPVTLTVEQTTGPPQHVLRFPQEPQPLAGTGWALRRVHPPNALSTRLWGLLRGQG